MKNITLLLAVFFTLLSLSWSQVKTETKKTTKAKSTKKATAKSKPIEKIRSENSSSVTPLVPRLQPAPPLPKKKELTELKVVPMTANSSGDVGGKSSPSLDRLTTTKKVSSMTDEQVKAEGRKILAERKKKELEEAATLKKNIRAKKRTAKKGQSK